jgi:hypothetical protein
MTWWSGCPNEGRQAGTGGKLWVDEVSGMVLPTPEWPANPDFKEGGGHGVFSRLTLLHYVYHITMREWKGGGGRAA